MYTYTVEEDNEGVVTYSFYSKLGNIYYISFSRAMVQTMDECPIIKEHGFGILIEKYSVFDHEKGSMKYDEEVAITINHVIEDFCNYDNGRVFIIYQCDKNRSKVFGKYPGKTPQIDSLVNISVDVTNEEAEDFIGFITRGENPFLTSGLDEFWQFWISIMVNR